MTVTASVREELSKLNPSSVIELFEVKTSARLHGSCEVYRFHAGVNAKTVSGHLVWANNTYYAWPVEADGFEYSGSGSMPRPKVRIANVNSAVTAILLEVNQFTAGSDLTGAEVRRIRTLARFLDAINFENDINPFDTPDPTSSLPDEVYYIDRKSVETKDVVEFELVSAFDLAGVRIPKRQTISNVCQWIYRGTECGYAGSAYFDANDNSVGSASADVCGKRLSSCRARFGQNGTLPFGSYPGVGQYNF
jgi:lambda family phage minor tail protein L